MRIAVFCLPGIGDALMATPMIRLLRKKYPHATIDVISMFSGVSYVFKNNPAVTHVYTLSLYKQNLFKGLLRVLSLRKNNYDVSILAFPAFRKEYHMVSWLLGAKNRIAHKFSKGYFNEWNFLDTKHVEVDESIHNVLNNLHLLIPLGISVGKQPLIYDLKLNKTDEVFGKAYIRKHVTKKSIIALHPGSIDSKAGVYKRWPVKKYATLAKQLLKKDKSILVFVGPFEKAVGEELLHLIGTNKNCVLVDNTSFGQSLGILKNITMLVSNDNGFAHIANALKVKEIVLFGPTNPAWCSPINKKFAHIVRKATFTPWFRNDMKVTNPPFGIQSGMDEIQVADVIENIERFS